MGVRLIFAPSLRHNIRVARVHNVVQRVCAPPLLFLCRLLVRIDVGRALRPLQRERLSPPVAALRLWQRTSEGELPATLHARPNVRSVAFVRSTQGRRASGNARSYAVSPRARTLRASP